MNKPIKVHFMGICGSGASSIAVLAKQKGFEVTGCDTNISDYYSKTLTDNGITTLHGHNSSHLDQVDICAISPAIMYQSPDHPEVLEAKKRGILMTWQEFMAHYLQKDMKVLSVAGTHGKSTTTIMLGLILETAGYDPNVVAGTTYKDWGKGSRVGKSDYFVCEADEFNNNFLNYESSIAVINNIEMDHPESFSNLTDMLEAYKEFLIKLKDDKILIVNEDSIGNRLLLDMMKAWLIDNKVNVVGYYINEPYNYPFYREYKVKIKEEAYNSITFEVNEGNTNELMTLNIPGHYNVYNAMSAICIAKEINVPCDKITEGLKRFKGIGRRFELVGSVGDILIYDDYAHHPTAVSSVLSMCKKNFIDRKIWAIFEPHQISRIQMFFDEFSEALSLADQVIITKTHIGREINKHMVPISAHRWTKSIGSEKTQYLEELTDIQDFVSKEIGSDDVIVVFGAANSYRISRGILEALQKVD